MKLQTHCPKTNCDTIELGECLVTQWFRRGAEVKEALTVKLHPRAKGSNETRPDTACASLAHDLRPQAQLMHQITPGDPARCRDMTMMASSRALLSLG